MSLSTTQVAQVRAALGDLMGATVAIETYSGESATGPLYAASANVTCNVHATRQLVRNADGDEVLSEFTIHVPAASVALFTPGSRVTVAGNTSEVLVVSPKTYTAQIAYVDVACK